LTSTQLDNLLRHFHRQIKAIRVLRVLLLGGTAVAVLAASRLPRPLNKQVMFGIFISTLMIWSCRC